MRSTNFEFLRPHYPDLANYGGQAETHLEDDPDSAGVKLRRFVEAVVDDVYLRLKLSEPDPNDLYHRLSTSEFERVVADPAVLKDMHRIRSEAGKHGAHHGKPVLRATALEALKAAHRIGIWFLTHRKVLVTGHSTQFVHPPSGGERAGKNAELKRRAKEARESEAKAKEETDRAKAELERLLGELSLVAAPAAQAADPIDPENASVELAQYGASLARSLAAATRTFVAPPHPPAVLIRALDGSQPRLSLLGRSGTGKSWCVRHAAEASAQTATVIYAQAKYFSGDLNSWLDAAVAPYTTIGIGRLARMSRAIKRRLILFIDGLDELIAVYRDALHQAAEALVGRAGASVVAIGREPKDLPVGWTEHSETIQDWPQTELASLATKLAARPLPGLVLAALRNPHDAAIAADAAGLHENTKPTAFELLGRYVEVSLPKGEEYLGALALGRRLEELLRAELRMALPRSSTLRELERFADERGLSLRMVSQFLSSRFIEEAQGQLSFTHSSFQAYFRAEGVLRAKPTAEDLMQLTQEDPDAARLLVPSVGDASLSRVLLAALGVKSGRQNGAEFRDDAIQEALAGEFGEPTRAQVKADLDSLWSAEAERTKSVEVTISTESGKALNYADVEITFKLPLGPYEAVLFAHFGVNAPFDPSLRQLAANLIDSTVEVITAAGTAQVPDGAQLPKLIDRIRAAVIWRLMILNGERTGASVLCRVTRVPFGNRRLSASETLELVADLSNRQLGSFCWLLTLLQTIGTGSSEFEAIIPELIARARTSRAGLLHEALHVVRFFGRGATGATREKIRDSLLSISTKDIFLSSSVLEALDALGEDLGFSTEKCVAELRSALQAPDDELARASAYRIYNWQFETVGSEAHCAAIGTLSAVERARFLAMAALGAPSSSFSLVPLLDDLIQCPEAPHEQLTLIGLRKWAVRSAQDPFLEDNLAWVAQANAGLAWFGSVPSIPSGPLSEGDEVQYLLAELMFRAAAGEARGERARRLWERLGAVASVAVEGVCALSRSSILMTGQIIGRKWPSVVADYPSELREFLHTALKDVTEISYRIPGTPERAVELLGIVGNAESRKLLLSLRQDPLLGSAAREAAKAIP